MTRSFTLAMISTACAHHSVNGQFLWCAPEIAAGMLLPLWKQTEPYSLFCFVQVFLQAPLPVQIMVVTAYPQKQTVPSTSLEPARVECGNAVN